jgi:23S rRNA (guanosine2251-2'-O)-methyltransferase
MKKHTNASPAFQIRQCSRPECRFRFPVDLSVTAGELCPLCHAQTDPVSEVHSGSQVDLRQAAPTGPEAEALLDNIRSTFNVGAMFRTADGAGFRRLHLCGITSRPDHPKSAGRIAKTALGAEQNMPWQAHNNILDAAQGLKAAGMRLWALEGGPRAESLFSTGPDLPGAPILLVVGNELSGVDPEVLALCERVVAIPMQGYKRSLNVAIAFGVAAYFLRYGVK